MSKHTPGPWSPPQEPNGKGMGWRAGPCWLGQNSHSEETAANARLVAAAPELLVALVEILSQIDQGGSGGKVFSRDYCIKAARAAVSRAT